MGIFKKKKAKDFFSMKMEEVREIRNKLESSANYQLIFTVFAQIVQDGLDISGILIDKSISKGFVRDCVKFLNSVLGLAVPPGYLDLPMTFIQGKAFFLTLPDPKIECESNYVAFGIKDNGTSIIVANEYYQMNDEFRICTQEKDLRTATVFVAKTLEEFIDITVNKILNC